MTTRMSTADRVHALLRDEILTGALTGQSSIYEIAKRLGVSRTPVRDAVLRLADAGMVDIERNRGVRIRGAGVHDVQEVFEARLLLEVPTAAYAARCGSDALMQELRHRMDALMAAVVQNDAAEYIRLDRQLHRALILSTGNERLARLLDSLWETKQAHGVSTFHPTRTEHTRSLHEVHSEHVPIVNAILERDVEKASDLMREHLTKTGLLLMRQIGLVTGEQVPDNWPASRFPL